MIRLNSLSNCHKFALFFVLLGFLLAQEKVKTQDKVRYLVNNGNTSEFLKRSKSLDEFLEQNETLPPIYPSIDNLDMKVNPINHRQIPAPDLDVGTTISSRDVNFDLRAAVHLLRRTTFGPTWEHINSAHAAGLDATVDALLEEQPAP